MNTRNDKNTIAQTRANMQVVHNILNNDVILGGTGMVKSNDIVEFELAA